MGRFSAEAFFPETEKGVLRLMLFLLCREEFGIEMWKVWEVLRLSDVAKTPMDPDFIDGVISHRGKRIPVMDLCRHLGSHQSGPYESSRIMVVQMESMKVGLLVDSVTEVVRASMAAFSTCVQAALGFDPRFLSGVLRLEDRSLLLLNIDRLFTGEQKAILSAHYGGQ